MNKSALLSHICITGTIGSGKSRVAKFLASHLHLPYLDVDAIARELMEIGGLGLAAITDYNSHFINADGSLDRGLLRSEIFSSGQIKHDIDALLHPLIQTALLARLDLQKKQTIVEIPLLFETGWNVLFDTIIVVAASKQNCVERIMLRDKVSRLDGERAHDNQMDIKIKIAGATAVIENDHDWQTTMCNILKVVAQLNL